MKKLGYAAGLAILIVVITIVGPAQSQVGKSYHSEVKQIDSLIDFSDERTKHLTRRERAHE